MPIFERITMGLHAPTQHDPQRFPKPKLTTSLFADMTIEAGPKPDSKKFKIILG